LKKEVEDVEELEKAEERGAQYIASQLIAVRAGLREGVGSARFRV